MVLLLAFFLNDPANVFEIHIVEARIVVKMKGRMIKVELLENSEKSADSFKLISRFLLVLFFTAKICEIFQQNVMLSSSRSQDRQKVACFVLFLNLHSLFQACMVTWMAPVPLWWRCLRSRSQVTRSPQPTTTSTTTRSPRPPFLPSQLYAWR